MLAIGVIIFAGIWVFFIHIYATSPGLGPENVIREFYANKMMCMGISFPYPLYRADASYYDGPGEGLCFGLLRRDLDAVSRSVVPKTAPVDVYVQDKKVAEVSDCGVTRRETHEVPYTSGEYVWERSLRFLFSDELARYGVFKSVSVSGGVAKVMLASDMTPTGHPIGALSSCEKSHLLSVLNDTLFQYKTITSVEIYSPEGRILF